MPLIDTRRLVLSNDLAELSRLAEWIDGLTRQDVPPDVSFAVALCLEEAVANIIMHGGKKEDRVEIAVEVERNGGALSATVEDNGRQFDPTGVPSPSRATSLDDAKVGDFGIHLMRSFASGMRYERRNGRNRLIMQFIAEAKPSR